MTDELDEILPNYKKWLNKGFIDREESKNGVGLNEKMIQEIIKLDPLQMFDVCSKCEKVELYGVMSDINETDFDLICGKCIKESEHEL